MTSANRLNARSSARLACASAGSATAESRLIGYQRLRCTISPYARASTAIAIPPTIPPRIPAEYGWTSTGTRVRCAPSPMLARSTAGFDGTTALGRSIGRMTIRSTCSSGRTSRHQPTAPISARTIPTTLTAACVTRPAKASVMPRATTIGHAVGAGRSICSEGGACSSCAGIMSGRTPAAPGGAADRGGRRATPAGQRAPTATAPARFRRRRMRAPAPGLPPGRSDRSSR